MKKYLLGTCSLMFCHVLVIAKSGRDVRIGAFEAQVDPGIVKEEIQEIQGVIPALWLWFLAGHLLQEEQPGHNLRESPE